MQYVPYESLGITAAVIAAALAFVVLAWNAVKAILDWRKLAGKQTADKLADHESRIKSLEDCCEEVHGKLNSDFQFQQDEKEFNVLMLEAIGQLLRHSIDGDDVEGLKAMDERINLYLIKQIQK